MATDAPASEKFPIAQLMGLHYADNGLFAESLEIYRWVAQQEGFESEGLLGVGNSYWMMRRPEDARAAYEEARRYAPDNLLLLFNLGLLNEQLGRTEDATRYYKEVLRLGAEWDNGQALARARRFIEARGG